MIKGKYTSLLIYLESCAKVCLHSQRSTLPAFGLFVEEDDLVEVHGNHFRKPFAGNPTVDGQFLFPWIINFVYCLL